MLQRGIGRGEVQAGLLCGEIIEEYPQDYPYPSCLILAAGPLHIVCGVTDTALWIVTAYRPSLTEWEPDFKTRKETRS